MVGGDKYTVDIKGSEAIAIGAGARAEINHYTEIFVNPDTIEDLPPAPGEPPYKGLTYFTEKDADIYYGRESLSQHISTLLSQQHFLALIGASGSGKTSLLRAGIIPHLREKNWRIHIITPGVPPLNALANSLGRDVSSLNFAPKLEKMMLQKSETLHLIGSKLVSRENSPRLLLAVDQFEEVFTQCHDDHERRAFVENLLTAAKKQGSVTILIGLRADFYDRCAHFDGLRELVSQQQVFIGPMNQQELVRIIMEPAKRGSWQFVEGLVEQILEDAGEEPGRLPLLSHALRETWERRRGVSMTLAGYRAAGGVEGAIAKTAEETLSRFGEEETAVAQSVFLSLTELGEGAEDTRRIAFLTELEEANADQPLDDVLQTLINARLITTGDGQVEVAHEAIIRRWPRLHGWLADNRERLRFERQLAQDAKEWEALGKDSGALYRGARLQQAIELVDTGRIEVKGGNGRFLVASREEAEREAHEKEAQYQRELAHQRALAVEQQNRAEEAETATKKQQKLTRIALIVGVFAFILAITAGFFWNSSQNAQKVAEENAKDLQGNLLAQQAIAEKAMNPQLSLLLAIESYTLTQHSDAHSILRTAIDTQYQPAATDQNGSVGSLNLGNVQSPYIQTEDTQWPVWGKSLSAESEESHYCPNEPRSDSEMMCLWSDDKSKYLVFETLGEAFEYDAFIVDAESGEEILRFPEMIDPADGGWQEEDAIIWLSETTSQIQRALDATSGKPLFQFTWYDTEDDENGARFFEFSNDLSQLIAWQDSGMVELYTEGNFQNPVWSQTGSTQWANFFVDGTRFITLDKDGLATAWDTSSQTPLLSFDNVQGWSGFNDIPPPIEWKSDGSEIAVMKNDGRIYIYPTESNKWINEACATVSQNLTWNEWHVSFPNETYYHLTCTNSELLIHSSVVDGILQEVDPDNLAEYFKAWKSENMKTAMTVEQTISEERDNLLKSIIWSEQITDAVSFYNYGMTLPTSNSFSTDTIAELCLVGSLLLQAEDVMFACEKAVESNPDLGLYRGARSIAHLIMNKDLQTAKEDIRYYLNWKKLEEGELSDADYEINFLLIEVLGWIEDDWIEKLDKNENPLDRNVRAGIRDYMRSILYEW